MPNLHFRTIPPKGVEPVAIEHRRLRPDMYAKLFAMCKANMLAALKKPEEERAFQQGSQSDISDKPVVWEFRWAKSGTSARVIWARPTGEGQKPDIQATSVFFTRMDAEEENAFLDRMKPNPHLTAIDPASYETVKNEVGPVCATFFVNEEAMRDSLIHALITVTGAAFFDQFGMADPEHTVKMKFKGQISVPETQAPMAQLGELALPDEEAQALFRALLEDVGRGTDFMTTVDFHDTFPVTIRFTPVGSTAAYFLLSFDDEESHEPKHMHGLTALLSKLDRNEDQQAIERVQKFACLQGTHPRAFEDALTTDDPVAASFFADAGSASHPPLMTINKILAAAFFQQFGIVGES